jgi:hypothetical protein
MGFQPMQAISTFRTNAALKPAARGIGNRLVDAQGEEVRALRFGRPGNLRQLSVAVAGMGWKPMSRTLRFKAGSP